jgi:hypothetical protein
VPQELRAVLALRNSTNRLLNSTSARHPKSARGQKPQASFETSAFRPTPAAGASTGRYPGDTRAKSKQLQKTGLPTAFGSSSDVDPSVDQERTESTERARGLRPGSSGRGGILARSASAAAEKNAFLFAADWYCKRPSQLSNKSSTAEKR